MIDGDSSLLPVEDRVKQDIVCVVCRDDRRFSGYIMDENMTYLILRGAEHTHYLMKINIIDIKVKN